MGQKNSDIEVYDVDSDAFEYQFKQFMNQKIPLWWAVVAGILIWVLL